VRLTMTGGRLFTLALVLVETVVVVVDAVPLLASSLLRFDENIQRKWTMRAYAAELCKRGRQGKREGKLTPGEIRERNTTVPAHTQTGEQRKDERHTGTNTKGGGKSKRRRQCPSRARACARATVSALTQTDSWHEGISVKW
jgi:hypothetical protein